VKVVEVDVKRKRIALTMRLNDSGSAKPTAKQNTRERKPERSAPMSGAFADAFANAKRR
jgi:uncharacterized protein